MTEITNADTQEMLFLEQMLQTHLIRPNQFGRLTPSSTPTSVMSLTLTHSPHPPTFMVLRLVDINSHQT